MYRILLFQPDKKKAPHIKLLLKVAKMQCTVIESVEELMNWLGTDHLKCQRFDLLLLDSWPAMDDRLPFFRKLIDTISLPVILVLRENNYRPDLSQRRLAICHPENLLSCIKWHLQQKGPIEPVLTAEEKEQWAHASPRKSVGDR